VHGDGSAIFFRAGEEFQNFFRFEVRPDGSYAYIRGTARGGGKSDSIRKGQNVSNVLGVLASGTDVALFCNGPLLTIVTDTISSSGGIGIGGDAYSENVYVNFGWAQIWKL
jgi:hypothetical protein